MKNTLLFLRYLRSFNVSARNAIVFLGFIGVVLTLPVISLAAPNVTGVSGAITHNSQINISGSGLGTKSPAAPFKYDSFESGTGGNTVTGWDQNNNNNAKYSNTYSRGVSTKTSRHDFGSEYNASLGMDSTFNSFYLDFWLRVDTKDGSNNPSRNFKPWRVYGTSGSDPQYDYVIGSDGGSLTNVCDGSCSSSWSTDTEKSGWRHYQIIFKESTPNVADGTFRHFIDSVAKGHNTSAISTRTSSSHHAGCITV